MPQDYPKMMYHSDGRTQIVHSQDEEHGLDGFDTKPSEKHLNPPQPGAARIVPAPSANDELIAKIRGLFEEFTDIKRGPGRPRKDSDNG